MTDSPSSPPPDPYETYLDLPSGERPPNYYQLLGLELFCNHPERIRQAVRKQFRRIKPNEDHPRRDTREAIQDIMTQIATANVVLTDGERKQAYDKQLAGRLGIDRDEVLRSRVAAPVPECALRITAGPDMIGESLELIEGTVVTLGRDAHCTVALSSGRMENLHCQIEHRDGQWLLSQVDFARPTLVNGKRCTKSVLAYGDAIDAGGYRFRFLRLPVAEPNRPAPPPLSLIIRKGPSVPAPAFRSTPYETLLLGSCETALWQLPDAMVSRHHCRIQPEGTQWTIEDLESKNHTRVNGQKVTKSTLENRDSLTIGRFEILVGFRR